MMLVAILILSAIVISGAIDDCRSFEDLPMKKIHDDPQRLQAYIDCILDKAECYEIDARIKRRAANIMATNCGDCSEKEKSICRDLSWLILRTKTSYVPELVTKYCKRGNAENFFDSLTDVPSLLDLPKVSGAIYEKYVTDTSIKTNQ